MATHSPLGSLLHEHRIIRHVVGFLRSEAEAIAEGAAVRHALIAEAVEFVTEFADPYHHGKEEEILFARILERETTDELRAETLDLIREHNEVRRLMGQVDEANRRHLMGDADATGLLHESMAQAAEIYTQHVQKEDRHYFRATLDYFTDEEQETMRRDFDDLDRRITLQRFESLAEELESVTFVTERREAPASV